MKKERFQSTLNLISENANELIEAMKKVNLGSVGGREYVEKTIKIVTERGEALEILRKRE